MKMILATAAIFGFLASSTPEVKVAADSCHQQCQQIENQCRIKSKDLDSSQCQAMFLDCVAKCQRSKR